MLTWTKNTILYWRDLVREIRIWWVFKKTADANVAMLNEKGLRVDWLGRIYTVVNLPEEVQGASQEIQQAYVLQKISEFGESMMKLGLGDIVYPEIQRINGTAGWLVILWPTFDSLTVLKIFSYLFRTSIIVAIINLAFRFVNKNWDMVSNAWNYLASFF
jgi:hypothetical protein